MHSARKGAEVPVTSCTHCTAVLEHNWVTMDVEEKLEVKGMSEIVQEAILRIEVPL